MATSITAESVLRRISEGHLECPICSNHFREPKMLDCFHCFCLRCLKGLGLRQDQSSAKLTVVCPLCRCTTMVKRVEDLPTNFRLTALVEEVLLMEQQLKGQQSTSKCQNCDEQNQAISRCTDCDLLFCQECHKAHGRMAVMKSHKIYKLAQPQSGGIIRKSELKEDIPKCGKHPDQNLCFYCGTCEKLICTACTVLDHKSKAHSIDDIPKALDKCIRDVAELVTKAKKNMTEASIGWAHNMIDEVNQIMAEKSCHEILDLKPKIMLNLRELTNDQWELKFEYTEFYNMSTNLYDVGAFSNGEIVVSDTGLRQLFTMLPKNQAQSPTVPQKLQIPGLQKPGSVSVNKDDQLIILDGPAVKIFNRNYQLLHQFTPTTELNSAPTCLAVNDSNLIAVGYQKNEKVCLHRPDGSLVRMLPAPKIGMYLCTAKHGFIYTASGCNKLLSVDYQGAEVFSMDVTVGQHGSHTGVCCDCDGSIYVATQESLFSGAIQHFSPRGEHIRKAINDCSIPYGITFTSAGDLVVAAVDCVKAYRRA